MKDPEAYLERIGLPKAPSVDEDGLRQLHLQQLFSIPFENLDVLAGKGVDVAPDAIFDKAVNAGRGGYCFENNGLFLQALEAFGFEARALLGRVHMGPEPAGRTHQITLVQLGGRSWLADVGFGVAGIREPIPLEHGTVREQGGDAVYRLVELEPWGTALEGKTDDGWQRLYSFDLTHVCHGDIETGNHYTATHPNSIFRKMPIVSRFTPEGRTSLVGQSLRIVRGTDVEQTEIAPGAEFKQALKTHFDLVDPR